MRTSIYYLLMRNAIDLEIGLADHDGASNWGLAIAIGAVGTYDLDWPGLSSDWGKRDLGDWTSGGLGTGGLGPSGVFDLIDTKSRFVDCCCCY